MIHGARVTIHGSRFTIRSSWFTVHYSQFTVHDSQFTVHGETDRQTDRQVRGREAGEGELGTDRVRRERGDTGREGEGSSLFSVHV